MAETQPSNTAPDFSKLTVPQLKALCKELKISGYSKLGKPALLEKLSQHGPISNVSTLLEVTLQREKSAPKPKAAKKVIADASLTNPTVTDVPRTTEAVEFPNNETTAETPRLESEPLVNVCATVAIPAIVPALDSNILIKSSSVVCPPPASQLSTSKEDGHRSTVGKKRKAQESDIDVAEARKKTRLVILTEKSSPDRPARTNAPSMPAPSVSLPRSSISKPTTPFSLPSSQNLSKGVDKINRAHPLTTVSNIKPIKSNFETKDATTRARRFVPLKPAAPAVLQMNTVKEVPPCDLALSDLMYLDYLPSSFPILQTITMPPSLSQRKRVGSWAVILSGLSNDERKQCVLVSRMFRYAVYLSAAHLSKRKFDGQRFIQLSSQYNMSMTDFWPILKQVDRDHAERKRSYRSSFLARPFGQKYPISERLWNSPDSEKQLIVVFRYLMTRVWFLISMNANNRETGLRSIVTDAQEIVKGEIWSITVASQSTDYNQTSKQEIFYILESTCEVIGHRPPPVDICDLSVNTASLPTPPEKSSFLRADWSEYIEYRLMPSGSHSAPPPPLASFLRWQNVEEYDRGIAKVWLKRIAREGKVGAYKKTVAERYVMACVVGNSVSGRWMSSSHMAQEFAGNVQTNVPEPLTRKKEKPKVNLFLPAHHLVESVHFTTSKNRPLHRALAVVQTPGREYYILRDNGMEVGCEEDGVWPSWRELLQCDEFGISL